MNGDRDGARDVVNRLFEATNDHDVESLTRCFAEDYVNETPLHPSRGFRGRDQVRTNWTAIFQGVPDIRAEIVRSAYDGKAAWLECEMAGLRRDGAPHLMRGIIVFQVENGLISSARFYLEPVDTEDLSVDEAVASAVGDHDSRGRSQGTAWVARRLGIGGPRAVRASLGALRIRVPAPGWIRRRGH